MSDAKSLKVAAVQVAPAFLDRDATIQIAVQEIEKAAADGAELVLFPESFLPGYPDWVWHKAPFHDKDWYAKFADQSIVIDSPMLDPLREAAKAAGVWVAMGITERDGGTLYNGVVYVNSDGEIAGVHRKLIPTGAERLVWGNGQGPILTVVDIGGVKVGSLICWENYMPLARVAMYEQGIDVLLSPTWDNSDTWVPTLRHIAKEGRIFVVGVTSCQQARDIPRDLPGSDEIYPDDDEWLSAGNTTIVAPGGEILAGPLTGEPGTVSATLDMELVTLGHRSFDPCGHYSRPDVLSLTVNKG